MLASRFYSVLYGGIVNLTEAIWHEYHLRLASFIKTKVSEDMLDDILQDVFIKVHTRLDSLKDETKVESWLYQITRNTIIDHYRLKQTSEQFTDWLKQPTFGAEGTIREELSSCLEPMIQQLPEKYRNAVQMSEVDNKTQKAIAELEGISLSGAKSRVQRGRVLLKGLLQDCCEFEINNKNQVISYELKQQECKFC